MKLCIFDTETTGLPKDRNKQAIKEPNNWPHIVSISWVILDVDTNSLSVNADFISYDALSNNDKQRLSYFLS